MVDHSDPVFDELRKLAAAYGSNPSRWPVEAGRMLEQLDPDDRNLVSVLQVENELDVLLDNATLFRPSPDLAAEILLLGRRRKLPWWVAACWPFPAVWRPATVLTIALLIGIAFGATYRSESTADYLDFEIDELLLG